VQAFASGSEMVDSVRPDVVHVLTPPATHVRISAEMLRAGSHVICEKPLASQASEVQSLLDVATQQDRVLVECQNYRYLDEFRWLKSAAGPELIGSIRTVEIDVRVPIASSGRFVDDTVPHHASHLAGGAVRDFLPHMVNLVDEFVPSLPIEVAGANWQLTSRKKALGMDTLTAVLANDEVQVVLRFSGVGSPPAFTVSVVGERGRVAADLFHRHRTVEVRKIGGPLAAVADRILASKQGVVDAVQEIRSKVLSGSENGMQPMLTDIYASLLAGTPCPIAPGQLLRTAQVVDDIVSWVNQ
jgi:predicted dehydrogenase